MFKLRYKTLKKGRKFSSYRVLDLEPILQKYPWLAWVLSDQLVVYKEADQKWRGRIVFSPSHHLDIRTGFENRRDAACNTLLQGIPQRAECMKPWETIR